MGTDKQTDFNPHREVYNTLSFNAVKWLNGITSFNEAIYLNTYRIYFPHLLPTHLVTVESMISIQSLPVRPGIIVLSDTSGFILL